MPGQDQTGPGGMGSMTGRGAGLCATGPMNNAGRGFGQGRGRGMVADLDTAQQLPYPE